MRVKRKWHNLIVILSFIIVFPIYLLLFWSIISPRFSKYYSPEKKPETSSIPLVAYTPDKEKDGGEIYTLTYWGQYRDSSAGAHGYVFSLPDREKRLPHPNPEGSEFNTDSGYIEFSVK